MDEDIETLVYAVRADTRGLAADMAGLRGEIEAGLGSAFEAGFGRAGRALEQGLTGAIRRGALGFEDLRKVALGVLADIASAAVQTGLGSLGANGGAGGAGGLLGIGTSLVAGLLGLPGRATGGPVSPGRPYLVGERGPELFVPNAAGRVESGPNAPARAITMTVNVHGGDRPGAPQALQRSGHQITRQLRRALEEG